MVPALKAVDEAAEMVAAQFPALTSKQISFVLAYVANRGAKREAAVTAGYAPASAHVEAHRLLQKPAILRAVQLVAMQQFAALLPGAMGTVAELSTSAKSEYVRLQAATDVLDRMGVSAPKQVRVSGDVRVSFDFGE